MTAILVLLATMALSLLGSGWLWLPVGTRSVLGGAHCWFLHPWFVARSWYTLHGWSRVRIGVKTRWSLPDVVGDPLWLDYEVPGAVRVERVLFTSLRSPILWLAFFVHDIGYIGKPNMDGPEGELHPYFGANLLGEVFGAHWFTFVLGHSRFLSKQLGIDPSPLCVADKLAICLTPAWLYLPMARRTREIHEYMKLAKANNEDSFAKYENMNLDTSSQVQWYLDVQAYVRKWVDTHKDGRPDEWTAVRRSAITESGVWK